MIPITVNGTPYQVPSSAADINWAAAQVAFEQALAVAANALAENPYDPGTWLPHPDYSNPSEWFDTGGGNQVPQYRKDSAGTVSLRGSATFSGMFPTIIFTLPVGFIPPATLTFPAAITGNSGIIAGTAVVDTSGAVYTYFSVDTFLVVDLSQISFSVEA